MERRIFHADFNGFYASVACLEHPELRPHPVAVAGDPKKRHGIILAKNELAKKYGVKTGEAIWQAEAKCPGLITVAPDFPEYQKFSALGRAIYGEYSDRVEPFGLDENWIDVTQSTVSFADAEKLADKIRLRVREELGITVSIGVADNKVFAKLGSDMKKPDAITVLPPDSYREKVWPLPARELLFVGRATEAKLKKYGVWTIGDVANAPEALLRSLLGKGGSMLHAFANGRDAAPVMRTEDTHEAKSIGNGITAPRDLINDEDVYLTLTMLSESVSARLRQSGLRARTVQLGVRDSGLSSFIRQTRLENPTDLTMEIARTAMALFRANYAWQTPVRSVTVSVTDLAHDGDCPTQLSLFSDEARRQRAERAELAVDDIRRRFGYHAIGRAIFLSDGRIGRMNPKEENTIHPVGYLQNMTMDDAMGRGGK